MDYTIYPYEGVGLIRFGMTLQQIHEIIGEPERNFMKTFASKFPTDDYIRLGFHIFYKENGVCEAVELFSPSTPSFEKKPLLSQTFKQMKMEFQSLDKSVVIDDEGLTSYRFGIGLYAPDYCGHYEEASIEAVIVFERGYYDKAKK